MRRWLAAGALAWGLGGLAPGAPAAPAAAVEPRQAPGWLVWWSEGQKAARQTGKPIFLVFR